MEIGATLEVSSNYAREESEIEIGGVRETLDEILAEYNRNLCKADPSKAVSSSSFLIICLVAF